MEGKLCSSSYSFHRFKFHNFHPANPSFYINPLRNTASLNFLRSVIISKLVPENPKFLDFRSSCFVRNSSFVDPGFVRSYCSARNSDGGTTDWTEEIEYLDESGSVIHKGKGVRSVEPGLDDHVMVGGMKRPFMNASIVAKIVELVKRWKWGPEVETQLDKLQFVPNMIHVTQALKVIKDSDAALSLFRWSKRQSWCSPSEDCFLILFDSLNQSRNFNEIQSLFDEMVQDSTNNGNFSFSACNRVIQYLAKAEKLEVSFCCFKKFQDSGCKVDTQTYNSLITLFLNKGLPYKAFEIYEGMEATHCSLHGSTYELLIRSLAKSGRLDAAFNKLTLTSSYKIDITVTRHY